MGARGRNSTASGASGQTGRASAGRHASQTFKTEQLERGQAAHTSLQGPSPKPHTSQPLTLSLMSFTKEPIWQQGQQAGDSI